MGPSTTTLVGPAAGAALRTHAPWIDAQAEAFTCRASWLAAAAQHLPGEPVVITVSRGERTVALAALSTQRRRGMTRISLLGGDLSDYAQVYYDDAPAAEALAAAVAAWLRRQRGWLATLDQLPEGDPFVAGLTRLLPGAAVRRGAPMPRIVGIGTDYRVKRDRRRKATGAFNHIAKEGLTGEKLLVADPTGLERWLPEVIEVRRERDHASGRRSRLDDPAVRDFHVAVLRDLFATGRGEMHLVLIDGEVAGFVTVVLDGDAHRLYDGRVAERWARFRGGVVCDIEAAMRAQSNPEVHVFDWLRGRTEAKFGNDEVHRTCVQASSGAGVVALDRGELALRRGVKAALPAAVTERIARR